MKKIKKMSFIILIILTFVSVPLTSNAKTFGQLKKELEDLETKLNENKQKKAQTEEEKQAVQNNINSIKKEMAVTNNEIQALSAEIVKLNEDIEAKDEEIKNVINFVQVANGESAYMEYIFGAKDFTDFIYRLAVSEQMVAYNDQLIKEYNSLIEQNNNKTKELQQKQLTLTQKQEELELEMIKLDQSIGELSEGQTSLEDQVKSLRNTVKVYEGLGCKDKDSIDNNCSTVTVPSGTSFSRPLTSGYVTSNYGMRYHPVSNVYRLHTGIDLSASGWAVPVYASANGKVCHVDTYTSCGGNVVYICHTINEKKYTSTYMHLRTIKVNVGQIVTPATVIGTMGGDPSSEYWDGCSTGQHLHFSISQGHYTNYSTWVSNLVNPRSLISFPAVGGSFSSR